MKMLITILTVLTTLIIGSGCTVTTQEAEFTVTKEDGDFEIRNYEPHILAVIKVDGSREEAGNKAFRPLFKFITGENQSQQKVSMTTPVSQEAVSEEIKMTAPVSQEKDGEQWAVSFMMPAEYTMQTVPKPTNEKIKLVEIPSRRIAAIRYSGGWSEEAYLNKQNELEAWIKTNKLTPIGQAIWARYNPPFTPSFFRRNEVLIPIAKE